MKAAGNFVLFAQLDDDYDDDDDDDDDHLVSLIHENLIVF